MKQIANSVGTHENKKGYKPTTGGVQYKIVIAAGRGILPRP